MHFYELYEQKHQFTAIINLGRAGHCLI